MQSYDLFMLLIVVATTLWGLWKGFAWQLASVTSVFSSYGLAYSLRAPVAKMIDAEPPWNMFAAMLLIYVLMSIASWIGFGMLSDVIAGLKLKDFDRQLGGLLGAAKGAIVCMIVTFFVVTLTGPAQQQQICQSRTGRYITIALNNSGGLIPPEIHAVVDPYLNTLQQKLGQHQGEAAPAGTEQATPLDFAAHQVQEYAQQYAQQYVRQYLPPASQSAYDDRYAPHYDPRYAEPRYSDQPRYDDPYSDPRYVDSRYSDQRYADPRYTAPRYEEPQPYDQRYTDQRAAYPANSDPRYFNSQYDPRYPAPAPQPPPTQPYGGEGTGDPRYQWR